MIRSTSRPRYARHGLSMAETVVTVAITSVALVGGMQLMSLAHRQSRAVEDRRLAWLEAGNVLEHVMARPWEELSPDAVSSLTLTDACRQALPEATLQIDIRPEDTDPAAHRITIEIRWRDHHGQHGVPTRLVAWRYRTPEVDS